ncbi:hypothetical protein IBX38_08960 [Candidatus Bathyarchaeota archaeon]|nr:hypothetical protein [Candidatus Bathyarchaeota archaeon]
MGIRKRLWNWCPRPKKPVSTYFTRLAIPLYVPILVGMVVLGTFAAVILPPILFSQVEESGRVTEVVERVLFPGGAIVVYKNPIYETPKWYISIKLHNYITCEEDLLAYVNSRTNALNELLKSLSADRKVQITATFKEPLESTDFKNLYGNYYFAESDGNGPNRLAINVKNETSGRLEFFILDGPSSEFFEEIITQPIKGHLRMINVISFEAFVRVDAVKNLANDPRILLVDPQECLTIRGLVRKYSLMGFKVTVDRPPLLVRVFTPQETSNLVTMDELLNNPSKYDRWRLYFVGKVSDLVHLEGSFFILNEKLLVCYKYYGIDLSEQIVAEGINNGDYVRVIGTFFKEGSTIYADKIQKAKEEYPATLTVNELLANPIKYDGQVVHVFGRISDLGNLDGLFFRLDGKILVCYSYDSVDLYSQISEAQNGDPVIVMGVFSHDDPLLYAEDIRPSKIIKQ